MFITALCKLRLTASLLLLFPLGVQAAERSTLVWDSSSDAEVVGYIVDYGPRPGQYTSSIDVGLQTQIEMPLLPAGTYYVAVRAYTTGGSTSDFSNEVTLSIPVGPAEARERSRADFNADGLADVLWSNTTTGQLAAWFLDGVSVRVEAGLSHRMPDVNWEIVGTGDLNGDKKPDLVWRHKVYGFLGAWYMNGLQVVGVVSLSTPRVADTAWKIAAVGDVTNDGRSDLVWQHDTGPLAVWDMQGITSTASSTIKGDSAMTSDPRWRVAGLADMNGDGQMDLLWQHHHGWLVTWLMRAGIVQGVASLDPVAEFDPAWKIVGNIDANLDGKQDILWQNSVNGSIAVWYMNGLTRIGTADIVGGSIGGPTWKVVGPK